MLPKARAQGTGPEESHREGLCLPPGSGTQGLRGTSLPGRSERDPKAKFNSRQIGAPEPWEDDLTGDPVTGRKFANEDCLQGKEGAWVHLEVNRQGSHGKSGGPWRV